MSLIARRQATDVERLGERHDGTIDEAQTQIRESSVYFHGAGELTDSRRRVREGASGEIL
jgi:hypothetical protein